MTESNAVSRRLLGVSTTERWLGMTKHTLGEKIKALRKNRKWSLDHLAQKVGVSQPFLSGVERGDKNPRLETLENIAEALSVSPALLQHPDIDIERLQEVSEIVTEISTLPDEKIDLVLRILQGLQK